MSTSTGLRPAKRAGGVLSRPEISRPSKLFQRTIDCSPNAGRVDAGRRVRRRPSLHRAVRRDRRRRPCPAPRCSRRSRRASGRRGWKSAMATLPSAGRGVGSSSKVSGSKKRSSLRPSTLARTASEAAAGIEAHVLDVPRQCARLTRSTFGIGEAIEHQLAELAAAIADEEEARAVALPDRGEMARRRLARRRQDLAPASPLARSSSQTSDASAEM